MLQNTVHALTRRAFAALGVLGFCLASPAFGDQNAVSIPTVGPLPGLTMINDANAAFVSLATLFSGGSAPTAGGLGLSSLRGVLWHDTTSNQVKMRNQADTGWVPILTIDETNGFAVPVLAVSASLSNQTVGATNHPAAFVSQAATTYTLSQTTTLPAGFAFSLIASGGNVTVSINGSDKINAGSSGAGMTIPIGYVSQFRSDGAGTWWVTTERSASVAGTIASASTADICSAGSSAVTISGTTTITSFGSSCQAGQTIFVTFSGALQLTYNATSMILNRGGSNYVTTAGDRAIIKALGSSNYEVTIEPGAGAAILNLPQSFAAGIAGAQSSPAISTSTFTPDFDLAQSFEIDLVHASCPCTIANPSHISTHAGQMGVIKIKQSSTGSDTVSWGSQYKFAGATVPTLSSAVSAKDYFSYYIDDATDVVISQGVTNAH